MSHLVIPGVYEIADKLGRSYIGSSLHIYRRWSAHKSQLRNSKHHSPRLQRSWQILGEEAFTFRILQIVPDESELLAVEQYYLDAFRPEFNISTIAGRPSEHSEEAKNARRLRKIDRDIRAQIRAQADMENSERICLDLLSKLREANKRNPVIVPDDGVTCWEGLCSRAEYGLHPWDVTDDRCHGDTWSWLAGIRGLRELFRRCRVAMTTESKAASPGS